MTGLCETCRWWKRDLDTALLLPGICPPEYGTCEHPSTGALNSMASYDSIGTGPQFGCVEHEPREVIEPHQPSSA